MVTGSGGGTSTGRSLSKPTIDHPEVSGGCQLTLRDLQLEISDTSGDIARCLGLSHKFRNKLGGKDVVGQCEGCDRFRRTHRKDENRELLDPQVKKALSMCVDRDKIIEVVFNGYADTVESLPGKISLYENKNLGPLEHDCDAGNAMLDQLGYKRGPDGIRIAPATTGKYAQPAHKMQYEIMQPTSLDFNGPRAFDIVKEGFAEAGVDVTLKIGGDSTAAYEIETTDHCDPKTNSGYTGWDIAMWDWVGYVDPDFMLSVVTKGQWCSWSDTGWDNPDYDALYEKQGTTVDENERASIVQQMEQMIYDNWVYTQLVEEQYIDAHTTAWDGMDPHLNAYAKMYWTRPFKTG